VADLDLVFRFVLVMDQAGLDIVPANEKTCEVWQKNDEDGVVAQQECISMMQSRTRYAIALQTRARDIELPTASNVHWHSISHARPDWHSTAWQRERDFFFTFDSNALPPQQSISRSLPRGLVRRLRYGTRSKDLFKYPSPKKLKNQPVSTRNTFSRGLTTIRS